MNAVAPNRNCDSLSTALAERRDAHFAMAAVLISAAFFLAAAPFAKTPLPQVPTFVLVYASALVMCDLVTAILLFGQFAFLRSRALLVLASGYLLTGALAVLQTLTFPGVFAPTGLFGVGPQFAPWVYIFWHAAFPLVVIAYALLKDGAAGPITAVSGPRGPAWVAILFSVTAVVAVVLGLTFMFAVGPLSLSRTPPGRPHHPRRAYRDRERMGAERPRAIRAVDTKTAHGTRPLVDGRDVRVDLRCLSGRAPQHRPIRPGLVCRPDLRLAGGKLCARSASN